MLKHKKNGNIDRKIVKGVVDVLKSVNLDTTQKAAVMVAGCVLPRSVDTTERGVPGSRSPKNTKRRTGVEMRDQPQDVVQRE